MKNIEKAMEALISFVLAEDSRSKKEAQDKLKQFVRDVKTAEKDPEWVIRDLLMEIGVPDHLTGYPYIIRAILLIRDDRTYIDNIVYGLYPTLAAEFDSTAARVERAMRHAIEKTWLHGRLETLDHYFGGMISTEKGKPTNGEFLSRMANIVKKEMRE